MQGAKPPSTPRRQQPSPPAPTPRPRSLLLWVVVICFCALDIAMVRAPRRLERVQKRALPAPRASTLTVAGYVSLPSLTRANLQAMIDRIHAGEIGDLVFAFTAPYSTATGEGGWVSGWVGGRGEERGEGRRARRGRRGSSAGRDSLARPSPAPRAQTRPRARRLAPGTTRIRHTRSSSATAWQCERWVSAGWWAGGWVGERARSHCGWMLSTACAQEVCS